RRPEPDRTTPMMEDFVTRLEQQLTDAERREALDGAAPPLRRRAHAWAPSTVGVLRAVAIAAIVIGVVAGVIALTRGDGQQTVALSAPNGIGNVHVSGTS